MGVLLSKISFFSKVLWVIIQSYQCHESVSLLTWQGHYCNSCSFGLCQTLTEIKSHTREWIQWLNTYRHVKCLSFLIVSFLCFGSQYAMCLSQPRLCLKLGSSWDFWFRLVGSPSLFVLSFCCLVFRTLSLVSVSSGCTLRIFTGIFTKNFCLTCFL